jgi:methyl-accepting chemotaxis protein
VGIFLPLLRGLDGAPRAPGLDDRAVVMVYMHERFWGIALLCFVLVGLGALKLSHRIAGPLVRAKRNLRLLAEGKLTPPLRTRRSDYLKEEVDCLNKAVAGVAQRVDAIRSAQIAVSRELAAALAALPRHAAADLEPLVVASRELQRSIDAFSTLDPCDHVIPGPAVPPEPLALTTSGSEVR